MNRRVFAIGIAIALVGAALWYVPLEPTASGGKTIYSFSRVIELDAPFDVLGAPIAFSLTWTGEYPAIVQLYQCGHSSNCSDLPASDYVTGGSGATGTLHWTGTAGEFFLFRTSTEPITLDLHYTQPLLGGAVGLAFVIFGVFLAVLGYQVVPPNARPAQRRRAPSPSADAGSDEEGS